MPSSSSDQNLIEVFIYDDALIASVSHYANQTLSVLCISMKFVHSVCVCVCFGGGDSWAPTAFS